MRSAKVLALLGAFAPGGPSLAELCTIDAVPAATLLVPYFECDFNNPLNASTLFSINNASAAPALAHVIFWTDWSYPTIDFDVYLTGYDVVTIDVCDVFNGNVPITADSPNDIEDVNGIPNDGGAANAWSPHQGMWSDNPHWDDTSPPTNNGLQGFPFCNLFFPVANPALGGAALNRLRLAHTGRAIRVEERYACVGGNFGDNVARGYITIDNVSECSLVLDPAGYGLSGTPYFVDGGLGVANNENQLWGDWILVDSNNNLAQGDTLVHIEANDGLNALQIPLLDPHTGLPEKVVANRTGYTFYGRYVPNGVDNREPLGTVWGSRYYNGGINQTDLIVWRDSTSADLTPIPNGNPGAWCTNGPSWFPLNETEAIAFNDAEDAVEICASPGAAVSPPLAGDPPCFPYETGRYAVGLPPLGVPFNSGWVWLNLNLPPDAPLVDRDFGAGGNIAQSYVTPLHSALGLFSVGLQAVELRDACQDVNDRLNGAVENGGLNVIPPFE